MDLKPKFCGADDFESEDGDDIVLSTRILQIANLGTCSNKHDVSGKRQFDNRNLLCTKVKKSKVSTYDDDDKDEDDINLSVNSTDKSFSSLKKDLALLEKLFEEGKRKTREEEKNLQSLKREIEECCKELENKKDKVSCVRRIEEACSKMQGKIEECVKDFVVKEGQLYLIEDLIGERREELRMKEIELNKVKSNISKVRELRQVIGRKEGELKVLSRKIDECTLELKAKEKDLDAMNKLIGGQTEKFESEKKKLLQVMSIMKDDPQMKELESMKKQFECQIKEFESREKQYENRVKELESDKKNFKILVEEVKSKVKQMKERVKEFESKEKLFDGRLKEFKSQEDEFEGRVKEFESKKNELEGRLKDIKLKEEELEGRVKELESKEDKLEVRMKEFESKEDEFDGWVKELELEKKHFTSQVMELETKENQFDRKMKEVQSKEKELEGRLKNIKSREEEIEGQVKDIKLMEQELVGRVKELESEKKQFERLQNELESRENKFKVKVKGLKLKEKHFGGQASDLKEKLNKSDRQPMEPELTERQYGVLTKHIVEKKDSVTSDQVSATIDGRGLQLDTNEKTDEVESLRSGVLVTLLESSDPAKLVLDRILNPTIPLCYKKGDHAVIINDSHINLLEQLMTISPNIKPCVREEALKLAIDLKANTKENTENYLAVLGFLLLLSNYGLVTSFNEDEILELFAFVAHYKIAAELFRNLGFANKVTGFVANLIKKKQFIGAVRFSCEYNLSDKNQLVDLLQEHVRNARQTCDTSCNNSGSIEIKDKARVREIASLGTVLRCISDHCLEPQDLFKKDIKYRILELKGYLDFVENLIKMKKFVGAVRFSCEYNLADNNQLVDLLQEHVRNAKQICDTSCTNSDSVKIKDKARVREIACLETVLQCISDHSLEPQDLFNKDIRYRILELFLLYVKSFLDFI